MVAFIFLLCLNRTKDGRGENNSFEMKKLAPGWKIVIGLFQKDQHSRPVNKSSCRQAQGMVALPRCGVSGWPPLGCLLAANIFLIQRFAKTPKAKWTNSGVCPGALAGHYVSELPLHRQGEGVETTRSVSLSPATGRLEFSVPVAAS